MPKSKSYTTKSPNFDLVGGKTNPQKLETKLNFSFSYRMIIFLSTCEALIHSIWISDVKVMNNLGFGAT